MTRIAICAPGKPLSPERAEAAQALAAEQGDYELVFHSQCFLADGHFAGDDDIRLSALVDCANDPGFDAVWFASGGYGSNRIAAQAVAQMGDAANSKRFLGYSDTGYVLAALYCRGIGEPAHGPMVSDIGRESGEEAVRRALTWLSGVDQAGVDQVDQGLEPSIDSRPAIAFNLMTLAMICGTELMPDLGGHVVMVEEVGEYLYAIDRLFFHITRHLAGIAGMRLGRVSEVPENDRPFGSNVEDIARYWCERAGIDYLGRADIGHDSENRIVPFGLARRACAE